jgi:hypothetical protein
LFTNPAPGRRTAGRPHRTPTGCDQRKALFDAFRDADAAEGNVPAELDGLSGCRTESELATVTMITVDADSKDRRRLGLKAGVVFGWREARKQRRHALAAERAIPMKAEDRQLIFAYPVISLGQWQSSSRVKW